MRCGLVCSLLLVAVAVSVALPQYGPQQQQETVVVTVEDPVAPVGGSYGSDGVGAAVESVLGDVPSDPVQQGDGGFWWQQDGVFNPGANSGSVGVVNPNQQPSSGPIAGITDVYVPTLSEECGQYQGCVPWQNCFDGVYQATVTIAQRSAPASASEKLCGVDGGYIGRICCRIPEEILAAQQQGQPGSGVGVPQVIGIVPGVEQVPGGYDGSGGVVVEQVGVVPVAGHDGGGVQVVEQVPGGYDGSGGVVVEQVGVVPGGGIVEALIEPAPQCGVYSDCVPYFQCLDGEINSSGAGLIDLRIKSNETVVVQEEVVCTNLEHPEITAICCRIPGSPPDPLITCPGGQECLAACNNPIDQNPDGLYTECYKNYEVYATGVCCTPPPPTPAPVVTCPGQQVCVEQGTCDPDGTVYTDGTGLTDTRLDTPCVLDSYSNGVCCLPPPPEPVLICPGEQVCVEQGTCNPDGTVNTDGTGLIDTRIYTPCLLDTSYSSGVCCLPPTPAPLLTCPDYKVCVPQGTCNADGTVITDGTGIIDTRIKETCVLEGSYESGVCCLPPPPPPLDTCEGSLVCSDSCIDPVTLNPDGSYATCYLDGAYPATGNCCEPPTPVVDACPHQSVCLPEILCLGDVLNADNVYVPYSSGGSWTKCGLSGGLDTPGVCCKNPDPVTPTPQPVTGPYDYTAAEKCGVRNYGLDVRIQNKNLKQYEAQFGEFPWQAIIFFKNFTFKCGASLIEDRWLLTAAHCVHGYTANDFQVRLGEWQVNTYDEPLKYVDAQIASITIHPDFVPGPVFNDVALIELTAPVTPQYHVNTVCLPQYQQVFPSGTRCIATGWGKDAFYDGNYQAIMKKVDLPIVEKGYCQELLRKTKLGKWFNLNQSFMCAGGEELQDACEGDGGGPLVCEDPISRQYFVAGITAWGIGCGTKDVPGVYVDVQLFTPWIEGIISSATDAQQQQGGVYGRK